jgi:hypothetical protein
MTTLKWPAERASHNSRSPSREKFPYKNVAVSLRLSLGREAMQGNVTKLEPVVEFPAIPTGAVPVRYDVQGVI